MGHRAGPIVHSEATVRPLCGEQRKLVALPTLSIFELTMEPFSAPAIWGPRQALARPWVWEGALWVLSTGALESQGQAWCPLASHPWP